MNTNTEVKSDSEAEQPKRGKWRRRVKNFLVALSAFLCLSAMVAWGFGMGGRCVGMWFPRVGNCGIEIFGGKYAASISIASLGEGSWQAEVFSYQFAEDPLRNLYRLTINPFELNTSLPVDSIIFPYWLLILLFALAPAQWWRRCCAERRQKKFFEEIVAAKRAEQQGKTSDEAM